MYMYKLVLTGAFYFHIKVPGYKKSFSELNLYDRHVAKCQFSYLIL